jgi:hypothetical protein
MHYSYRIGISILSEIIQGVCKMIWDKLKDMYFPFPTQDKWLKVAGGFNEHANFPNCLGAVDGEHVRIIKPRHSGSAYYNYKHLFFYRTHGCGTNYCFTCVDIGSYGKCSDSGIFTNCLFWEQINSNSLNISESVPLEGTTFTSIPYVFVADETFGLSKHVMQLYGGKNLDVKKRVFTIVYQELDDT